MVTEAQKRHPFVGPRPFERQDRNLFFGRDRETSELLSLIIAHRALLLYAQSGAGKTSLLNARLIPRLEEEAFEVLPLARVRGPTEEIEPEEIPNLYIFNTITSWLEDDADTGRLAKMSLAGFLKERKHLTDSGLAAPRVIVFDQFEELFAFYQERWEDREGFFQQVGDALAEDPLLRVVFSIREDYIAQLDPYAHLLPENLRTRFRMERLRQVPALAAVTRPLKDTGRAFAEGVAEELVDELMKVRVEVKPGEMVEVSGQFIEPVQLQVVCQSLWQGLPPNTPVITKDHLQDFGDVDDVLAGLYERSIKQAVAKSAVQEGALRRWFEHNLITPAGTRGTVWGGPEKTGGIPNTAVAELQNLHLIRGEWRAGGRWYELTHDRFIQPIQRSNEKWRAVQYIGLPEQKDQIIDFAESCEQREAWEDAGKAYERLLELDRGDEEQEKRWTLALARVKIESQLTSLHAEVRRALKLRRWTYASENLVSIRELRPDDKLALQLEEIVNERRQERKRRARMNAVIIMATTALLDYFSGVWLAGWLGVKMSQELPLNTIGALAAISGLTIGGMYSGLGIDFLDLSGLRKIPPALRFLFYMLFSWFISEVMLLFIGLLGWGAGALTLWVFNRFTGFYIIVWGWGIITALATIGLMLDVFQTEPSDPRDPSLIESDPVTPTKIARRLDRSRRIPD